MWTVVTWPLRSRRIRRVLLVSLGLLIRHRVRATGVRPWSHDEDGSGRTWWPWAIVLLVGALATGVFIRTSRARGRPVADDPTPRRVPSAVPRGRDQAASSTAAATTPQRSAADPSQAPDLAAGETVIGRKLAVDDLKVVEGIGPKIEQLLNDSGVHTWHDLSTADVDRLRSILSDAGARYRMHDPSSWPQQATLLARGDWKGFATLGNGDVEP